MTDAVAQAPEEAGKSSKLPMVLGVVAALAGGAGGFYATFSGVILADAPSDSAEDEAAAPGAMPDVSFVPLDQMTVSLSPLSQGRHLIFRAQLEVPSKYEGEVQKLLPRVVDVLNGYLRAVRPTDFEQPAALTRLRSQMLRRVQIVVGPGRINDLLVMEFVLN